MQWYTFWAALVLGLLGLCVSIVQLVLSAVQLSRPSTPRNVVVGTGQQPSAAVSSPPGPIIETQSDRVEESGHQLSSGAIVGIIFGAIGVGLLIIGIIGFILRSRKQRGPVFRSAFWLKFTRRIWKSDTTSYSSTPSSTTAETIP